jgi:hypothetical protein
VRDRWTVTVALLVALTSVPTFAALSAGTATLRMADGPSGTTPFFARPAGVSVVVVPAPLSATPGPTAATRTAPAPRAASRRRAEAAGVRVERGSASGGASQRRTSPRRSSDGASSDGASSGSSASDPARPPAAPPQARSSTCPQPGRLGWRPLVPVNVLIPGSPRSGAGRCS